MVCNRCKMVVQSELERLGLHPITVELGEVEIEEENLDNFQDPLNSSLSALGFELMTDKQDQIIEKIKTLIIELVHHHSNETKFNLSDYLAKELSQDYNTLSHLFSETEGRTIEKYFIAQKIEKVKELLIYNDLTLSEIAYQLNYSSVGHLSNQFKKVTGFTPTAFKNSGDKSRSQLDKL